MLVVKSEREVAGHLTEHEKECRRDPIPGGQGAGSEGDPEEQNQCVLVGKVAAAESVRRDAQRDRYSAHEDRT